MSPLAPLIVSWIAGVAFLIADGRRRRIAELGFAVLVVVAGLDFWLLGSTLAGTGSAFTTVTGDWPAGIGIRLRTDGLSLFFGAVSAASLAAVMYHESRVRIESRRFPALILLMCAGLHGAFFTGDLFNFYVFFELAVVTSFALAIYGYGRSESRAALIYMVVNLLGSVLFLLGVTSLYHETGSLDFVDIAGATADGATEPLTAAALLFASLALKLGLFPFHGWLVPVYKYVRPPIAAALAGALVNIGAYGLLRIGLAVLPATTSGSRWLLLSLGAAATVYGSLLAFRRRAPAELAAYLAIVHAGYVMLGIGVGGPLGVAAVLLVVVAGSIDKTVMFLSLDLSGAMRRHTALIAAIGVAGLPFSVGFLGKVQLFRAGASEPAGAAVIVALLIAAPLTIAAAARFWWNVSAASTSGSDRTGWMPYLLPAVSLLFGIAPAPLGDLTVRLGTGLLGQGP